MKAMFLTTNIIVISFLNSGCAGMPPELQSTFNNTIATTLSNYGGGKLVPYIPIAGAAVTYLLSDPFTQSALQNQQSWKQEIPSSSEAVKTSEVRDQQGQVLQKIDLQKTIISENDMVNGNHLSESVRKGLAKSVSAARQVGGTVAVFCPGSTPQSIIYEISSTGAEVRQDSRMNGDYEVLFARNSSYVAS